MSARRGRAPRTQASPRRPSEERVGALSEEARTLLLEAVGYQVGELRVELAARFGGGGHVHAAGARVDADLDEAFRQLERKLEGSG